MVPRYEVSELSGSFAESKIPRPRFRMEFLSVHLSTHSPFLPEYDRFGTESSVRDAAAGEVAASR